MSSLIVMIGSEQNFITSEKSMYHIARSDADIVSPWDKLIDSNNYNKMVSINQITDTNTYFTYNDYIRKNAKENEISIFNHELSMGNYKKV